jgi:hypothetical protein
LRDFHNERGRHPLWAATGQHATLSRIR